VTISGRTRVFALLGRPVAHSVSPQMHNAAFTALGLDAVYVALACEPEAVRPLIRSLAAAGGGGNVTVPHKAAAAAAVDRLVDPALPACNTFWLENDGEVVGGNTDVEGILQGAERLGTGAGSWLILGTGGSARAAAEAARQAGAAVAIRSRDPARAAQWEAELAGSGMQVVEPASCEMIVNATPLGLAAEDPLPAEPSQYPALRCALDLVYARGETRWVRAMRAAGVPAADGRVVLVAQGAAAFRRWFPEVPPPVEVMRAAVHAALG